jgi:hypothetical protein
MATETETEAMMNKKGETLTHLLKIQYNGRLMEKYLLENDFPVWGEYRPDVVVWLVVRDGRREYVLKDSDNSLLKTAAAEALARRGIPVRWPLYDKKDKKALNVADIRGGFKGPVQKASRRYSRGPALTGSMIWNGKQWQSSWGLFVESENRHWTLDDTEHKQLINKAVDQAADMLGVAFAVHNSANKQQEVTIQLDIQKVDSIENYRYVENYLAGLSAVEKVKPFKVEGQNAVFEVSLRSNEEDFLGLIKHDAQLTETEAPQAKKPPENLVVSATGIAKTTNNGKVIENEAKFAEIKVAQDEARILSETESSNATEKGNVIETVSNETDAEKGEVIVPQKPIPVYYYKLNKQ